MNQQTIDKIVQQLSSPEREKDIQTLCKSVLVSCINWEYQSNSYDRFYCVFCNSEVNDHSHTGDDIVHKTDCPYLIAKDLITGLR